MTKMWAGRFKKEADAKLDSFNTSLPFDCRLYKEDIEGSLAHSSMLYKQGIISLEDKEAIHNGLNSILNDIENNNLDFSGNYEDIHMFIEKTLTERIGDAGKRLHTARSRNDQIALDMRLYVKKEIKEIQKLLISFLNTLCENAMEHTETIMPGFTHMQHAQPISLAHWMMAYANMLKRDYIRLDNTCELMNECPLGSGALATTTYPIDREYTSELLNFRKPMDNSLDGVSDRDYCIELASDLSILMMHLSRMSEEIIQWSTIEFHFLELDDAYSTGSSIMPQKKNPDICELIRGKSGRVYGSLISLLTALKSLPLAYNKDLQEDKEAIFNAIDTVKQCLEIIDPMFDSLTFIKENMEKSASKGFINATDCADYLVKKGLPFRDAYYVTGKLVAYCSDNSKTLNDCTIEEFRKFHELFDTDVYSFIDLNYCLHQRKALGGPSPEDVKRQIQLIKDFINSHSI